MGSLLGLKTGLLKAYTCNNLLVSGTNIIYGKSQVNKSNQYHNPIDDAEIVANDRSVSELAHLVVTMTGSGLKSAQKVKVTWRKPTLTCIDNGHT